MVICEQLFTQLSQYASAYGILLVRCPFCRFLLSFQVPSHLSVMARDLIDALLKKNPRERIRLRNIMDHPFMKRGRLQDLLQQVLVFFRGKDRAKIHTRLTELSFRLFLDHPQSCRILQCAVVM